MEMVTYLKNALAILVNESAWMDDVSRALAVEKIKEMKTRISHSPWLKNNTLLEMYCGNVKPWLMYSQCYKFTTIKSRPETGEGSEKERQVGHLPPQIFGQQFRKDKHFSPFSPQKVKETLRVYE